MGRRIRVGTRASALATAQARLVLEQLRVAHSEIEFELKFIRTGGDHDQKSPLTAIGGQGIFVKEIENALLACEIDLAVHSLKDMPSVQPEGLTVGAVLPREDPRDALISRHGLGLHDLPEGARVGTGSLRRKAQLLAIRPDFEIVGLRGNVDTRLRKAMSAEYDAVVLAAAGLVRLGRAAEITQFLSLDIMLPAVGQGAIAVEVRAEDVDTQRLVAVLNDPDTQAATTAERTFLRALGGGCHVPIAAHGQAAHTMLWLRGLVGSYDGAQILRGAVHGPIDAAADLGQELARNLLEQGADKLLEKEISLD